MVNIMFYHAMEQKPEIILAVVNSFFQELVAFLQELQGNFFLYYFKFPEAFFPGMYFRIYYAPIQLFRCSEIFYFIFLILLSVNSDHVIIWYKSSIKECSVPPGLMKLFLISVSSSNE